MWNKKNIIKLIIAVLIGSVGGYAYYHFIGCQGGCPLTSTWYISTFYGAIFGFLLGFPSKSRNTQNKDAS